PGPPTSVRAAAPAAGARAHALALQSVDGALPFALRAALAMALPAVPMALAGRAGPPPGPRARLLGGDLGRRRPPLGQRPDGCPAGRSARTRAHPLLDRQARSG
ncbi:hypothetical protein ACWEPR_14635, partial [Streptomyces sp. NPDC004290]